MFPSSSSMVENIGYVIAWTRCDWATYENRNVISIWGSIMSKDKVANIEGYEFHIVNEGLDAAEVTDFVKKFLSLSSLQEFGRKMEAVAAEAEQVAGQVKKETIRQAKAEKTRLLAEAEQRARELMAEAETAAAAIRKEAAEEEQRARELMAETEKAETAIRGRVQELLQVAQSKAEQVIARIRHLMEHGICVATDRMYQEFVSMLDGLEAELKASPGWQGQSAEEPSEEPEEAVAVPVSAEGEAEAQPEATDLEEEAPVLYEGRVLLVVPGGTSALELRHLEDRLRIFPEVKIVSQSQTMGGGNALALSVERPLPLIQHLIEMPNVESAKEATYGILDYLGPKPERRPPVIRVCLKNVSTNPLPRRPT